MSRALLLIVALVGCRYHGVFVCADDSQCSGGRCELTTGYCSFADGMCPSGFRYGDSSGDGYANECVAEEIVPVDAAIDAPPDALPFNPATCPSGYNIQIDSTRTVSRYRLVVAQGNFWAHAANCDDDLVDATHLVMPQNVQEIIELSEYIDPLSNTGSDFHVGAVQATGAASLTEGWVLLDGTPVPSTVWAAGSPFDDDGVENGENSVAFFDKSPSVERMFDTGGTAGRGGVCECDGKTYAPNVRGYIDADPNNPN